MKITIAFSIVFYILAGLVCQKDPVKSGLAKCDVFHIGQNIFFDVALMEKGDSVILALKNKGDDTISYYLGFFGKDSVSSVNRRYDCNLLLESKISNEKQIPMLQILPRTEIRYRTKLSKDMLRSLHGFYKYKYFIGARTGNSWNYLNLREEK